MHPLLAEGLTDAAGFLCGVLAAWGVSTLLGWNPLTPTYDSSTVAAVLMAGVGGGAGIQLARRWRRSRKKD